VASRLIADLRVEKARAELEGETQAWLRRLYHVIEHRTKPFRGGRPMPS
jgi:hypothetical protein